MLRDAALAWMRSNICDPRIHLDFIWHYDQAAWKGVNCYVAFGAATTFCRKPHLLHCFGGELFIFELSAVQARLYHLDENQVMWGAGGAGPRDTVGPVEPIVTLCDLVIRNADHLSPTQPIVADLSIDTDHPCIGPCAMRLDYQIPGLRDSVGWHYFDPVPARARVRCGYLPLQRPQLDIPPNVTVPRTVAPLAMFFRLFQVPDLKSLENRQPISNTLAGLVCLSG